MTKIHVTSQYKSKEDLALITKFARFIMRELHIHNYKNSKIHISLNKMIASGDAGDCHDWHWKSKKVIKIRVRPYRDIWMILQVLAHELVHARQYMTGKLKSVSVGRDLLWHGESLEDLLKKHKKEHLLPFEKEAYGKEEKLMKKWIYSKNLDLMP